MPTSVGQVTYSNLPHGAYVLNVLATDEQGSWDSKPLQYSFIINTPFYRTAIFIFSMIILVLGSISLYFYFRVRKNVRKVLEIERIRQQEQDNLRKEIARDFHDEMGNQLTRIINYISLIKLNGNGHAIDLYNKVEDSAKYLYTGTKDFIWSIDPVNDELIKLFIHIRDFGEKLFEEKGIKFRAYNEIKEKVKIPYGFSREANLIMKEAMTNAFNHSKAENVSFTLRQDAEKFELVLKDDGVGFNVAEVARLNGIKNMRTRAERMHSILRIQSSTRETGTTIILILSKTKTTTHGNSFQKKSLNN
jgi:signal transduction histidine kinase